MAECGRNHRAVLRRKLNPWNMGEQAWFECMNCGKRWGWNDWIIDEKERTVKIGDLFEFMSEDEPDEPQIFGEEES